jgi:hypothetical protein
VLVANVTWCIFSPGLIKKMKILQSHLCSKEEGEESDMNLLLIKLDASALANKRAQYDVVEEGQHLLSVV